MFFGSCRLDPQREEVGTMTLYPMVGTSSDIHKLDHTLSKNMFATTFEANDLSLNLLVYYFLFGGYPQSNSIPRPTTSQNKSNLLVLQVASLGSNPKFRTPFARFSPKLLFNTKPECKRHIPRDVINNSHPKIELPMPIIFVCPYVSFKQPS